MEHPDSWSLVEPCVHCELFAMCKAEQLACQAFVEFARKGNDSPRLPDDEPNHKLYCTLYSDGDPNRDKKTKIPGNPGRRMQPEEVRDILWSYWSGVSVLELARRHDANKRTIQEIIKGNTHKNIHAEMAAKWKTRTSD